MKQYPQALTIAGIDCDGGGGMPIDLKTMEHLKVYCHSVITENVATNSHGLLGVQTMPLSFIEQQFQALTADYQIRACKTGLLANAKLIQMVAKYLQQDSLGPLVADPVCLAKTGEQLIDNEAIHALKKFLLPLATVLTPNFLEAQLLTGISFQTKHDVQRAAHNLQALGSPNIIIKGKHVASGVNDFILLANGDHFWLPGKYFPTKRKNGSGDALSSAITAYLALGLTVKQAIIKAQQFVQLAIANPLVIGKQIGPINLWATR